VYPGVLASTLPAQSTVKDADLRG